MLTAAENELLTRVGPGTAAGDLLRRYWQPVGMPPELTDATPIKHVRILGEDLVLFRDRTGRVGLLGDHCPHRGASLLYGRIEERGIACAYHGWLYDVAGNCLETPAEPAESNLRLTVQQRAYPVHEYCGLYWGYLGPRPAPRLPRYDLAEAGPVKAVSETPLQDCNWLQIVENTVDQAHIFILHQNTRDFAGGAGGNTTRGFVDDLAAFQYAEEPFGIRRRLVHTSGYDDTDLIVFPATQRIYNQFIVKVPIDDTHTREYHVYANLAPDRPNRGMQRSGRTLLRSGSDPSDADGDGLRRGIDYYIESATEGKDPPDAIHPFARYRMDQLRFQDFTVTQTQGPISARENEHLATTDRGVALLRTMIRREIEKVQEGIDPIGVVREGDDDLIDTHIDTYVEMLQRFPSTPHL